MNLVYGTVIEGREAHIAARVVNRVGTVLVPADVASYTLDIYDLSASTRDEYPVYEFASSSSSTLIQPTLVVDKYWSADDVGYNFLYPLAPPSPLPLLAGHVYRVEVWLTATGPQPLDTPVFIELSVIPAPRHEKAPHPPLGE
jgi:hypothetical protein